MGIAGNNTIEMLKHGFIKPAITLILKFSKLLKLKNQMEKLRHTFMIVVNRLFSAANCKINQTQARKGQMFCASRGTF